MPFRAVAPEDFHCTREEGSSESEETAAVNSYLAPKNTNDNRPFGNQQPSGFGSNPLGTTTQVISEEVTTDVLIKLIIKVLCYPKIAYFAELKFEYLFFQPFTAQPATPTSTEQPRLNFARKPAISETKAELLEEKAEEGDKDSKDASKANPFDIFSLTFGKSDNSALIPSTSGGIFSTPNKTGLFGTPSTCATSTSVLFGTPSKATAASSGILGTSTGLFGAPYATTTSSGLFGTLPPTASTTGGYFGTATPSACRSLFPTDKPTPSFDGLVDVSNMDGIFSVKSGSTQALKLGGELFKTTDKSPKEYENDWKVDVNEHNMPIQLLNHIGDEPNVDFKHVTPLPGLANLKTLEDEQLFGERANFYRMDTESKSWKKMGVGELKLLKDKESGRVRIIMRRDQELKLCANHQITEDMTLQRFASSNVAWYWFAQDYAEGEFNNEQFAAQFKTPELAQMFKYTFEQNQRKLTTTPENPKSKDLASPKSETTSRSSSRLGIFSNSINTGAGLFGTPSTYATTASALFGTSSKATTASSEILGTSTWALRAPKAPTTSKGLFRTLSTTASTTGGLVDIANPSASVFATDKSTPSFDGLVDAFKLDDIWSTKSGSTPSLKLGGEMFKTSDKSPKKSIWAFVTPNAITTSKGFFWNFIYYCQYYS